MIKIPHLFVRDEKGLYKPEMVEECDWVLQGIGYVSLKLDGVCVKVEQTKIYRKEVKQYLTSVGGEKAEKQEYVVWKELSDDTAENKAILKAFDADRWKVPGIYEVIGPDIKGNPHNVAVGQLIKIFPLAASIIVYTNVHKIDRGPAVTFAKMYDSIYAELNDPTCDVEGVVFQREEWTGGVSECKAACQVTKAGFGIEWPPKAVVQSDPIEVKGTAEITGQHFGQFDMNNRMW